ncbi:hypothetical protein Acr_06g0010040 [Actinidia rufa]|uniref:Uncharacterized protein n=1 Tax=Actinidia rufa TaxID=165716 RepID=A0A7J0ERE5_9ERIC|nr:hypothetical protein Acr_06g0010040 [Actinidia rufa]
MAFQMSLHGFTQWPWRASRHPSHAYDLHRPDVMPPRRGRGRRGAVEPEDRVDCIERILEGLVQVVHDVHNNNNHDDAPQQPTMPMPEARAMPRTTIKQFQQLKPLTFYGTSDPMAAESWLLGIERKEEDKRKHEQKTKFETTRFRIVEREFIYPTKEYCKSRNSERIVGPMSCRHARHVRKSIGVSVAWELEHVMGVVEKDTRLKIVQRGIEYKELEHRHSLSPAASN